MKELIDLNLITVEKDTYYYERGWIYSFSFEENIINPLMNNKKDLGFFIPVKGLLNEYYSFENLIFDLINNKDFFSKVKFFVPEEFNKTDKVLFTQESIIEPFILAVIIKNAMK